MIEFKVEFNPEQALRALTAVGEKDLPFVTRAAINGVTERALDHMRRQIPRYIDRPTDFTVNSLYAWYATKSKPEAGLQWREWNGQDFGTGRPLFVQSEGGQRRDKGFERLLKAASFLSPGYQVVPTADAPVDGNGNVQAGFYKRVISYLRADVFSNTQNRAQKPGLTRDPARQKSRAKRRTERVLLPSLSFAKTIEVNGVRRGLANTKLVQGEAKQQRGSKLQRVSKHASKFFVVSRGIVRGERPGYRRLSDGIYERIQTGFGTAFRKVFAFVPNVTYRKRFPAQSLFNAYCRQVMPFEFDKAVERAIKARASFRD